MDKTAIKNYAVWARNQLIESCKQKAYEYGITEDGENRINIDNINGRILTAEEKEQRRQLIDQINQKGYSQVMEEAAYTWFNRFIALRFMEVNGYLPSKVRVFTDEDNNFKPEILKEAMTVDLDGIDKAKVADLLEMQDNEALYKYLLITQCNALNSGLPYMFETISNWTELLFPTNLLRNDSVIGQMISSIPEEDWTDQVQIIGWLYQYYNSELKDETFALLKKNVKITKERIPAATQLFTPDWIVRYMVENSLGRLWYEGHKDFDKSDWKYYLDEAEQEPVVEKQLVKIREEYSKIKPEEIKVIDPCMGSGHILVYMFDVLTQIYTSAGWTERDAAKSIIENNLYGLDIDDRAGQLAYFAVMMKARKYNRRIMSLGIEPNVMSIQDSSFMTDEFINSVAVNDTEINRDLNQIKEVFTDAKEYGSILNVPCLGYGAILERIERLQNVATNDVFQIQYEKLAIEKLRPLVKQAMIMSQKYDAVVTNPPYMGSSGMSTKLQNYIKKQYPVEKTDLYTCFIKHNNSITKENGFISMITMESWMFLASFKELRESILNGISIQCLTHMPYLGKGGTSLGINFGTVMFILRKKSFSSFLGNYNCVTYEDTDINGVPKVFPVKNKRNKVQNQYDFKSIPATPIGYWLSKQSFINFNSLGTIRGYISPRIGLITGDNNRFLRLWHEVSVTKIGFNITSIDASINSRKKWFPYQKGGDYRNWFGNMDYVVDWENDGYRIKNDNYDKGRVRSHNYNGDYSFISCITWTSVTTGIFACRYAPKGFLFDAAGPICKVNKKEDVFFFLGLLNSAVSRYYLKVINPTINYHPGYIMSIPFDITQFNEIKDVITSMAKENVIISNTEWNQFEHSWDFKKHPLI